MAERYSFGGGSKLPCLEGDYVLASDFDRMRRRLVVKLLRERGSALLRLSNEPISHGQARRDTWLRCARWFIATADAVSENRKLAYFNRLGQDKP